MKKFVRKIALILALIFLMPVLAQAESAENGWYFQRGEELKRELIELINSDEYAEVYGVPEAAMTLMREWREALAVEPKRTGRYSTSLSLIVSAGLWIEKESMENLPKAAVRKIEQSVEEMTFSLMNGQKGVEHLTAASVVNVGRSYLMPEDFERCILLYEYDGICIGVIFKESGEGVVSGWATIVAPEVRMLLIPKETYGNQTSGVQINAGIMGNIPADSKGSERRDELNGVSGEKNAENAWCLEKAEALRDKLYEMVSFDGLAEFYTPQAELIALIDSWKTAMKDEPKSVKGYPLPAVEMISEFVPEMENVPEALIQKIDRSMANLLISQINGMEGVYFLSASSIPTLGEGYIMPENFSPCIVLYEYEGICVSVSFAEIGEGVVSATAQFVSPRIAELLTAQ